MAIEFIGMIGVRPEGADGAAVHVIGGEIDMAWVRDYWSALHEHSAGGGYVNFLGTDDGPDRVAATYGGTTPRTKSAGTPKVA